MFGMKDVDKDNPPQIPVFDQSRYKYPSTKQVQYTEYSDINILQHSDVNVSQQSKKSEGCCIYTL
jgi:hypothetical protein